MSCIRCYFGSKPKNWVLSKNGTQELYLGESLNESPKGFYIDCLYQEIQHFSIPKENIDFFEIKDYHQVDQTNSNKRLSGEYKLGSAHAVCCVPTTTGGKSERFHQEMTLKGPSWDDLQELHRRLRSGTIRPIVSYENPQVKPLPIQFLDWLRIGLKIVKRDVLGFRGVY
jgi:hypothetical protein